MSFCRITGKSRNLPKPNFFPIIPPISPADARKICRITAKRMDHHNYLPLLEIGKRPDCAKGKAGSGGGGKGKDDKENRYMRTDNTKPFLTVQNLD